MGQKHFLFVGLFLLTVALYLALGWSSSDAAQENSQAGRRSSASYDHRENQSEDGSRRIREGTLLKGQTGYFRQDGDIATFVTDDERELGGLPNLNLERVLRTLKTSDENQTIRWRVDGTITEFSGKNYLLITRAVYKSAAPPPAPEHLTDEAAEEE